eukprot:Platyproteum_vivax@DN2904_c0_g1_i1.p1
MATEKGFFGKVSVGGEFPPEKNRYHLYISLGCPYACRALMLLKLKGLEDAIGLSIVHPTFQRTRPNDPKDEHCGWTFAKPGDEPFKTSIGFGSYSCDGCIPDPLGNKFVRDLYDKAGDISKFYSVPVLWDMKTSKMVSNDSNDIMIMLNDEFNEFAKNKEVNLRKDMKGIEAIDEWLDENVVRKVYKIGFAKTQDVYDEHIDVFYENLQKVDDILAKQRFIAGPDMTTSDIKLFVGFVRFDECYVTHFKLNKARLMDYPNIRNWLRDVYQTKNLAETVNMKHIKTLYFSSNPTLNHYGIIPKGPGVEEDLKAPHNRK